MIPLLIGTYILPWILSSDGMFYDLWTLPCQSQTTTSRFPPCRTFFFNWIVQLSLRHTPRSDRFDCSEGAYPHALVRPDHAAPVLPPREKSPSFSPVSFHNAPLSPLNIDERMKTYEMRFGIWPDGGKVPYWNFTTNFTKGNIALDSQVGLFAMKIYFSFLDESALRICINLAPGKDCL